jgi:hypothetical protein
MLQFGTENNVRTLHATSLYYPNICNDQVYKARIEELRYNLIVPL